MYKRILKNMRFLTTVTLILTAVLVFLICYPSLNDRLKKELQSEVRLVAGMLNDSGSPEAADSIYKHLTDKRMTIFSESGSIIYDSIGGTQKSASDESYPEVTDAKNNGFGEAERYSSAEGATVYCCAMRLDDGSILRISGAAHSLINILISIAVPALLLILLVYILAMMLASKLTDSIVKPINSVDMSQAGQIKVYDELKPFTKKLSEHREEIQKQIAQLRKESAEKEQAIEIRKEFSANVSHELKTPLTAILGYSQIINNGIAKPEDIAGFSEKIEKEATRLITLIDDIIKLSHLDEQADSPVMAPVSLSEVARDVADRLSAKASQRGITISVSGSDGHIMGNASQITELVYNLCDNAIKYNKNNGKINISVNERQLLVSDTGIGIPQEYLDRIFERFFRVDKSHSKTVNGTGLGLSIVKHIAMCHNASISVDSTPGEGTVFTVTFNN